LVPLWGVGGGVGRGRGRGAGSGVGGRCGACGGGFCFRGDGVYCFPLCRGADDGSRTGRGAVDRRGDPVVGGLIGADDPLGGDRLSWAGAVRRGVSPEERPGEPELTPAGQRV
jgi:hypothetical protein